MINKTQQHSQGAGAGQKDLSQLVSQPWERDAQSLSSSRQAAHSLLHTNTPGALNTPSSPGVTTDHAPVSLYPVHMYLCTDKPTRGYPTCQEVHVPASGFSPTDRTAPGGLATLLHTRLCPSTHFTHQILQPDAFSDKINWAHARTVGPGPTRSALHREQEWHRSGCSVSKEKHISFHGYGDSELLQM